MGDIYCLLFNGGEIERFLCSGDCSSCIHYSIGKCFKIAAEDADEVERVKDLLRHLREPVTECNQLPKLTVEVFDRPDCPEWAKYAAVDEYGMVWLTAKKPNVVMIAGKPNGWTTGGGSYTHWSPNMFESSDWQNSLIERPENETKLPDWCKVDAICWHKRCGYFKVIYIDDVSKRVDIQQVEDKSKGYLSFHTVCNEVLQANLRPFNTKEMKALVGRTVAPDYEAVFLVTKFVTTSAGGEVAVDDIYHNADELLDQFTIDDKPCGVLEHKDEKGVWVS